MKIKHTDEYKFLDRFDSMVLWRWSESDTFYLFHEVFYEEHVRTVSYLKIADVTLDDTFVTMKLTFHGRWLIFLKLKGKLI